MGNYDDREILVEEWLDFFAAKVNHPIMKLWSKDRDHFFSRYMIIDDAKLFIVGDKVNYNTYEFPKVDERLVFDFKEHKEGEKFRYKLYCDRGQILNFDR